MFFMSLRGTAACIIKESASRRISPRPAENLPADDRQHYNQKGRDQPRARSPFPDH